MILKFLILTAVLSAGIQAIPNVEQQQISPTLFQEQIAAWATHHAPVNTIQELVTGSAVGQQQHDTHLPPAAKPAAVHNVHADDIKMENSDNYYEYQPFYEDQVTVFPFHDDEDTSEEQEVWPPVGIFPPPPPPPIRPTYYPPYYPTTARPTIRPTTQRPRPPQYPTLYPQKPPHYPQYPISILPQLPHYPRPTTARPTTTKRPTTTQRPTTQRPIYTTTPAYQKPGGGDDTVVLENYQILSDKGIKEYKLRLSNGLSDYKKITKKHIGKHTIYVQSGYYSVPVDPKKNKFNIIHYIADEKGYRIVGVQPCSSVHKCKALE